MTPRDMAPWTVALMAATAFQLSGAAQVYCYHDSQSYWRRGNAQFRIRHLEEALEYCSKVVYGFAIVDPVNFKAKPFDSFLDTDEGHQHYRHVTNLKRPYPNLQVLLSIGSKLDIEQRGKYLTLLESAENRTVFINSARAIARQYGFDGVELAWQFPEIPPQRRVSGIVHLWEAVKDVFSGRTKAQLQKIKRQRDGFTALVRDLKAALLTDDMILTAVSYPLVNTSAYFDIPEVIQHLDAVVLRAMDYNTPERNHSVAGLAAPLNSTEKRSVPASAVDTVKFWLANGAPAEKLVLGIPTFGRTWKVRNESFLAGPPPVPADGPGAAGPLTKTRGIIAYPEICNNFTAGSSGYCSKACSYSGPNQTSLNAFCRGSLTWVSFDDPEMAGYKATYARQTGLGGVEVVDLSLDDFAGQCGQGAYPILREVHCSIQGDYC